MMDAGADEGTVATMVGYEYLPVVAGALSAAIAIPATRIAAKLTASQPIEADVAAEADLIASVLKDPLRYRLCVEAQSEDFTWALHRDIWASFELLSVPCWDQGEIDEAEKFGVEARTISLSAEELVEALQSRGVDAEGLAELVAREPGENHLEAGAKVIGAAHDRNLYIGASRIEPAANPTVEAPLERHFVAPTAKRTTFAAAVAALGAAASTWAAGSLWAAAAALVLWVAVLTVVALVDYDTLYIDMRLFWGGTAATIAVALASDGALDRAGSAALWGLGAAAAMWTIAVGYAKVRGINGLGSGDVYLTAPLFAVPILLGADPQAALWGILAGMVIAIVVVGLGVLTGRRSKEAPFAFGPYLAAGWPFGWALFALLNR